MKKITASILALFMAVSVFSKPLKINQKESFISYFIVHKLHDTKAINHSVRCAAEYDEESGEIKKVAVLAYIKDFDSGNGNLDSHMMEVVDAIKYPSVKFISKEIKRSGEDLTIKGDLTFHGVTKEVTFKAKEKKEKSQISVIGSFPVTLEKYKVERPSLMMVPVDENAMIDFTATFDL